MTGVDLLAITGIIVAAVVATNGIARLLPTRRARIQPLPPTVEHQACHRCRTGSTAWPCTCDSDCYAPACTGWYSDTARHVLRGDA